MEHSTCEETFSEAMQRIKYGAFLTVRAGAEKNVMTIGWAMMGILWNKPMVMVAVRPTRFTYDIIEKAADFSISIPLVSMTGELNLCGTKSGRTIDKFKECRLKVVAARKTHTPVLKIPGLHYECRIVYKSAIHPQALHKDCQALYPMKDYHMLYYGEILAWYETTADNAE